MPAYTYTQLRDCALQVLAQRGGGSQYESLQEEVFRALEKEGRVDLVAKVTDTFRGQSSANEALFLDVFWDLFRDREINLGVDRANPSFPWFHVSAKRLPLGERRDQ